MSKNAEILVGVSHTRLTVAALSIIAGVKIGGQAGSARALVLAFSFSHPLPLKLLDPIPNHNRIHVHSGGPFLNQSNPCKINFALIHGLRFGILSI